MKQELSQHTHAAFTRLKYKDAVFIKNSLQDLFIHGRDHAITHGHAFCQQFVWWTYKKTFGDTQVYERLLMQPSQVDEFLRATCSRPFLRRYKWGINLRTSSLPIAYLLLKQKKDFQGARPIISYIHFLYAKLFRATAIALDVIMRATCPRSFGLNTLPSILQQLTQFLQMLPDDAHPVVFNQDLVGFFTSIPVFRILNAGRWAVNEYCMLQKSDAGSITFSVNLREQDTKLRTWRGRPHKAAKRTVLVHLSDIADICELSCDASVFTVMHNVFRQTRGATIGNQISPMPAELTVSIEEEIYVRHLQRFFDANKPSSVLDTWTTDWLLFPTRSLPITGFNTFFATISINILLNSSMLPVLMHLKSFWGLIHSLTIIVCNYYYDLIFGRFENPGPERHRTAAFHCAKIHIERHVWPPHIRDEKLLRLCQNFAAAAYHHL